MGGLGLLQSLSGQQNVSGGAAPASRGLHDNPATPAPRLRRLCLRPVAGARAAAGQAAVAALERPVGQGAPLPKKWRLAGARADSVNISLGNRPGSNKTFLKHIFCCRAGVVVAATNVCNGSTLIKSLVYEIDNKLQREPAGREDPAQIDTPP